MKKINNLFLIFFISLLGFQNGAFAQTDTDFWFVVPEVTYGHNPGGGEPTYLHIATLDAPATITIEMPQEPAFTPVTFTLGANSTQLVDLTWYVRTIAAPIDILTIAPAGASNQNNIIESGLPATCGLVENKGIHISSTNLITAYLERNNNYNNDIWALKGQNAFGTDFYVPTQNWEVNGGYNPTPFNAIDIVATEDTRVWFAPTAAVQNIGPGAADHSIVYFRDLSKGQSISLRATGTGVANHLGGTHIWSNGDVVVSWKDDSVAGDAGCFDLMGDQIVPTDLAGDEYIVMRGELDHRAREFVYVMSLANGAIVDFTDPSGAIVTTRTMGNPGDMQRIILNNNHYGDGGSQPANTVDALHIKSRGGEPFVVFHVTGFGCELGAAILPTIKGCTGSTKAYFQRSVGGANGAFFLNIMCKSAHIDDFFIEIGGTPYHIPGDSLGLNWFTKIGNTGWWYLDKAFNNFSVAHGGIPAVPVGQVTNVYNTTGLFHLGVINGGGSTGCRYGYFSDFSDNYGTATIGTGGTDYIKYCFSDTIQLQATGGISYLWENVNVPVPIPGTFVDPPTIGSPRVAPPSGSLFYRATISRACYLGPDVDTTIFVQAYGYPEIKAIFDTVRQSPTCCSPTDMDFINNSIGANRYTWNIERVYDTIVDYNVTPGIINYVNREDTTKLLRASLQVSFAYNCPDTVSKLIAVAPEILAKSATMNKSGCQQDVTQDFSPLGSSGPYTHGIWDWGDGTGQVSFPAADSVLLFTHTFTNLTNFDTIYDVRLIVIDSLTDCIDTAQVIPVTVPGVARARYAISNKKGCSPLSVDIENLSNGIVEYAWWFRNGNDTTTNLPDAVYGFSDTTLTFTNTTPDTINYITFLRIKKVNDDGSVCYDYFGQDTITVYPEFTTDILPAGPINGCNPLTIDFSQTTTPNVATQFEWDFGDGTTSGLADPLPKTYSHTQDTDQNYVVSLITTSDYECKDTATVVDVSSYAFVDSRFSITPDTSGCSPFTVTLNNTTSPNSVGNFVWNLNGGAGVIDNSAPFDVVYTNLTDAPVVRTISLVNSNSHACNVIYEKEITVHPEIEADFAMSATTICHEGSINFTNTSYYAGTTNPITGAAATYFWEFGDGTTSSDENPVHQFQNTENNGSTPQKFYVRLSITAGECTLSYLDSVYVNPQVIAGIESDTYSLCSPSTIEIRNTSVGATDYLYQFSDGLTGPINTMAQTAINYNVNNPDLNNIQTYDVTLTASNGSCTSVETKSYQVYPNLIPSIAPDRVDGCGPLEVVFTNLTTGGNLTDLNFVWDFDDTQTSISNAGVVTHTFENKTGADIVRNVTLTATNAAGCSMTTNVNITVFPEVVADFNFIKTTECTPMDVEIQNSSLNGTRFDWLSGMPADPIFRNDNPTFDINYSTSKANDTSIYNIILFAIDENHPVCRDSDTLPIVIYPEVVADFSVFDADGCGPHTTDLTNGSTGYDLTYTWNYDDGNTSAESALTHAHEFGNLTSSTINYDVTLVAFDANGCFDVVQEQVTVYPEVRAEFAFTKLDNCTPYPVEFSYPAIALNGNEFVWDFGDGTPSEVYNNKNAITHTFDNLLPNTVRTYTVTLTSTDLGTNCTDNISKTIEVYPRLIADFSPDVTEGCNPLPVNFTNQTTGLATYYWDYGNGESSPNTSPSHTFTHMVDTDQTYNVVMTALQDNTGCTKTHSDDITVFSFVDAKFGLEKPVGVASAGIGPNVGGCTPFDIVITDSSTTNGTWSWDFGDGSPISGVMQPGLRTYTNPSNTQPISTLDYTITLTVENTRGCTNTFDQTITVYPRSIPDFSTDYDGCSPHIASFTNLTIDDNNTDYFWTLGDGGTSVNEEFDYRYLNFSYYDDTVYNIKLKTTTQYYCSDSITKQITVFPKPFANFYPENNRDCSPFTAIFHDESEGNGLTVNWDFDNGNTDVTGANAIQTETYSNLNNSDEINSHDVQIIVENNLGCTDTLVSQVHVYPEVTAGFDFNAVGCSPLLVEFINTSNNASELFQWDFGNGSTSAARSPSYNYVNTTGDNEDYFVQLEAESIYGCTDDITQQVTVYPSPITEFVIQEPVQMYPDTSFTFVNITNSGVWDYTWSFGDGTTLQDNSDRVDHSYFGWAPNEQNNIYDIWLKAYGVQCADSIMHSLQLLPPTPLIQILNVSPNGCVPYTVDFSIQDSYVEQYLWEFADGSTSTDPNPQHTFTEPGIYNVKLTVFGDGGSQYDYKAVTVHSLPGVDFKFAPDFVMLPDQPVQFYNLTTNATAFYWEFGDGKNSVEDNPQHQYTAQGVYPVTLTAYTEHNCIDSLTINPGVTVSGEGFLEFPNAFLPSTDSPSDGSYSTPDDNNNVFHPYHEGVRNYELWIYNRWGEQVFYSEDVNVGWNGRYGNKGDDLGQDVYFYKAKGNYNNDVPFKFSGDITLIRK